MVGAVRWPPDHARDEEVSAVSDDEQVVSEDGGLCTIKDCCIVLCDGSPMPNPGRGTYTDHEKLEAAYDAIKWAVIEQYDQEKASAVYSTLKKLPVVYNARLSRAIGRAKFDNPRGLPVPKVIELTGTIDIPQDYLPQLLIHEGCHVACAVISPATFAYESPHGWRWADLMTGAGQKPAAMCADPRILDQRAEPRRLKRGGPTVALREQDVSVGDRVSFEFKRERLIARVVAKTPTTATVELVESRHAKFRVGYGLLTKEPAP